MSAAVTLDNGIRETCFGCGSVWGKCRCKSPDPDDFEAPGFDYKDCWITSPFTSVCGRFFVDPFVYYGDAYVAFLKTQRLILSSKVAT